MNKKEQAFAEWFGRQGFKHFSAQELLTLFRYRRKGVSNSVPPKRLWKNLVPTLRLLDHLRKAVGPIHLHSTYRSPAYNAAVGGVRNSRHLLMDGIDFSCSRATPRQLRDKLLEWRRARKFKGGLGLYNTFVHVDCRGYNATWGKK